jgi:hypothetical protein
MWLISVMVLLPVLTLAMGLSIPPVVTDPLDAFLPRSGQPSSELITLSYFAGVAVASTPLHLFGRYLPTMVHELGHAFTAGVLGGRPRTITIHLDTSGLAVYDPPANWGRIRSTLVSGAGYVAPPVASIAAIEAINQSRGQAWFLFAGGTLALAIVFLVRNIWGVLWTAAVVGGCYAAARFLPGELLALSVPAIAGYLSLEGIRDAMSQSRTIRRSPGFGTDAERIAYWWGASPRLAGYVHLVMVLGLSWLATREAIGPNWDDLRDWLIDTIRTQVSPRLGL